VKALTAGKLCYLLCGLRLAAGALSEDDSTATASDVDVDNSRLASGPAGLSDTATDKSDKSIRDRVTSSSVDVAVDSLESKKTADTKLTKSKLSAETASMPMVRLERLSDDRAKKGLPEEARIVPKQTPVAEHNYFSTSEPPDDRRESRTSPPITDNTDVVSAKPLAPVPTLPPDIAMDHCYCVPFLPAEDIFPSSRHVDTTPSQRQATKHRLSDLTNVPGSRELSSILPPAAIPPPRPRYQPRDLKSEIMTLLEFILGGVDAEDVMFLRRRYEQLLQYDSEATDWLNDTHWVDHPPTYFTEPLPLPPPRKRRKGDMEDRPGQHLTGQYFVCIFFTLQGRRLKMSLICSGNSFCCQFQFYHS